MLLPLCHWSCGALAQIADAPETRNCVRDICSRPCDSPHLMARAAESSEMRLSQLSQQLLACSSPTAKILLRFQAQHHFAKPLQHAAGRRFGFHDVCAITLLNELYALKETQGGVGGLVLLSLARMHKVSIAGGEPAVLALTRSFAAVSQFAIEENEATITGVDRVLELKATTVN